MFILVFCILLVIYFIFLLLFSNCCCILILFWKCLYSLLHTLISIYIYIYYKTAHTFWMVWSLLNCFLYVGGGGDFVGGSCNGLIVFLLFFSSSSSFNFFDETRTKNTTNNKQMCFSTSTDRIYRHQWQISTNKSGNENNRGLTADTQKLFPTKCKTNCARF